MIQIVFKGKNAESLEEQFVLNFEMDRKQDGIEANIKVVEE